MTSISNLKTTTRKLFLLATTASLPLLSGCSLGGFGPGVTQPQAGVAFAGIVHGGQQPISGGHVYLFEAGIGSATYTAAPVSLLTSASGTVSNPAAIDADGNYYVPTTAAGAFSISGHYTCDTADSNGIQRQVYALSIGGNPQISSGNPNQYITLMAAFGDCNLLNSSSILDMNEITTAASATALQQFANLATGFTATPTGFSTSSTNTLGLKQAMATANNLYDITTGEVRGTTPTTTGGTGTVPRKLLIDFGNVLGYCVNSDPTQDVHCSNLSTSATGSNSPIADTLADAIGMAQNPSHNVATLWGYIPPTSAFGTALAAAPNDWTIAIAFTAPAMYEPNNVAIDADGNVWVVNSFVSGTSTNNITEFDNLGNVLSGSTGFTNTCLNKPLNVAIDTTGVVWVVSDGANGLCKMTSAGAFISKITGGGMNATNAIAIDASNNVWVSGFTSSTVNNTLSKYIQGTTNAFSQTTTLPASSSTFGIRGMAFDTSGSLWAGNSQTNVVGGTGSTITQIDSTGTAVGSPINLYATSSTNAQLPYNVAVDANNYIWVADADGAVSEFNPSGILQSSNGYRNSNFSTTRGIAVDGTGNIWAANYATGSTFNSTSQLYTTTSNLAKLAGSQATTPGAILSGTTNLKSDQQSFDKPAGIAIDNSGNLWLPMLGINTHATGSVVEVVGVGSPVITPLAVALAAGKLGTRP